jgi:hypothetical protein
MENMNPALALLLTVKRHLERGQSTKVGIMEYLQSENDAFRAEVANWFNLWKQGLSTESVVKAQLSIYRSVLLQTLERGLQGEPIYNYLQELETEIIKACEHSLSQSLGRLPFILLVPLLLFQLPAFMLLLFGPILGQFLEALGAK